MKILDSGPTSQSKIHFYIPSVYIERKPLIQCSVKHTHICKQPLVIKFVQLFTIDSLQTFYAKQKIDNYKCTSFYKEKHWQQAQREPLIFTDITCLTRLFLSGKVCGFIEKEN